MANEENPILSTVVTDTIVKRVDEAIKKKGMWKSRSEFVNNAIKHYLEYLGF